MGERVCGIPRLPSSPADQVNNNLHRPCIFIQPQKHLRSSSMRISGSSQKIKFSFFFSKKDILKFLSRICKEENKEQTEVVLIDVGFTEGQVLTSLNFLLIDFKAIISKQISGTGNLGTKSSVCSRTLYSGTYFFYRLKKKKAQALKWFHEHASSTSISHTHVRTPSHTQTHSHDMF